MISSGGMPFAFRDRAHVVGRRRLDVDRAARLGADGDLVHVDGGAGEEHRARLRERDHGDRVGRAACGEVRPLEGVNRDVDLRPFAVADGLAVEQHRRLVLLSLADHHRAAHAHGVEHRAHAVDRSLVGGDLVPAPDPRSRSDGSGLGNADELEREVAIRRRGHQQILNPV